MIKSPSRSMQGHAHIQEWAMTMQTALSQPLIAPPQLTDHNNYKNRRLRLYQDLIRTNLHDFIDVVFPISKSLCTPTDWGRWLDAFAQSSMRSTPLFKEISEQFLNFLNSTEEHAVPAALLALMRWEWLEMAVEIDSPTVSPTPFPCLKRLNPTLRIESFDYPVHTMAQTGTLHPFSPTTLLVWRTVAHTVSGLCPHEALLQLVLYLHQVQQDATSNTHKETWDVINANPVLGTLADELIAKDILL